MNNTPNTSVDEDAWLDEVFHNLLTSYVMPYTPEYENGKQLAKAAIKAHIQKVVVVELRNAWEIVDEIYDIGDTHKAMAKLQERIRYFELTNTERKDGE